MGMAKTALDPDVVALLEDKIHVLKSDRPGTGIYVVGPVQLPVNLNGDTVLFQWYSWMRSALMGGLEEIIERLTSANLAEMQQSSVLVYGEFHDAERAVIRFHSICHTGDIFGSKRCDCGFQLKQSMKMIVDEGAGALFYLANHEGRGIGLFSKAMAYILQENGYDTVEANLKLGFKADARNYDDAIRVLKFLRTKPVLVITNNPKKLDALRRAGMDVAGRVPLWGDVSEYNARYLQTKVDRAGHLPPLEQCPQNDDSA
jgi:GTP cyclohydrolase II